MMEPIHALKGRFLRNLHDKERVKDNDVVQDETNLEELLLSDVKFPSHNQ